MTRKEGVLRVNLLAPVAVLLRREVGHRCTFDTLQSIIARDFTDGFGRPPHNFEAFLIADLAITTRGHTKFVLDKQLTPQGPLWRTNFRHVPENQCFVRYLAVARIRGRVHRQERSIARGIRKVSCNCVN